MIVNLLQTCGGCPESYDAYINKEYVGNLRLRHGNFTVHYKDDDCIYEAQPDGDGLFESDERNYYLTQACLAIIAQYLLSQQEDESVYQIVHSI